MKRIDNTLRNEYFALRNVNPDDLRRYTLPQYLIESLPTNKETRILDIGCGFGQLLQALSQSGYSAVKGIDISVEAIEHCVNNRLNVELIDDIITYCISTAEQFDVVFMCHVLEHLPKDEIVHTLSAIRTNLLKEGGLLFAMVPNAQSNTGCYWAYEDFTHSTLFTAGSIDFVMKAAGFRTVRILDRHGLSGSSFVSWAVKKPLLMLYSLHYRLWNWVTNSSFHRCSPRVFSYDIKVLAQ